MTPKLFILSLSDSGRIRFGQNDLFKLSAVSPLQSLMLPKPKFRARPAASYTNELQRKCSSVWAANVWGEHSGGDQQMYGSTWSPNTAWSPRKLLSMNECHYSRSLPLPHPGAEEGRNLPEVPGQGGSHALAHWRRAGFPKPILNISSHICTR